MAETFEMCESSYWEFGPEGRGGGKGGTVLVLQVAYFRLRKCIRLIQRCSLENICWNEAAMRAVDSIQ